MMLQHLDVKLPVESPLPLDLEPFIAVFHRWVREQQGDGLLIDVADYRHVFAGPGVVLVGHDANYSLDQTGGRTGLRYIRKTPVAGDPQAVLAQALDALDRARVLLEADAAFGGALRFSPHVLELRVNDRLLAPNCPETFAALRPELLRFFEARAGTGNVRLSHRGEPRETFRVDVEAAEALFPARPAA